MATFSLCMIVKNEEAVLRQCLSSAKDICDEIVIVDTGSTDRTKEIAAEFTSHILDFTWTYDFSAARQYAFDQATMDYIMWLDADDVLLEQDRQKLKMLKDGLHPSVDVVSMLYHVDFDSAGHPTFSYRRHRIVKRTRGFRWIGPVHEYLEVGSSEVLLSDAAVTHNKSAKPIADIEFDRNLNIYENRLKRGEAFSPRDLFYYANELRHHHQYLKAIMYYRDFLASKKGGTEDEIRACINMADCYSALGDQSKELESLVMTMKYDVPRPEVSCKIGDIYKTNSRWNQAVFWYRLALEMETDDTQGFVQKHFSTWYPHLQLCVCYWNLGEQERAYEHNNQAKKYWPDCPEIQRNDAFFKSYFGRNDGSRDEMMSMRSISQPVENRPQEGPAT